jgi:HK97 family phage prohead protease
MADPILPALSDFRSSPATREVRNAHRVEIRSEGDGADIVVEGYASVFDEPYEVWDWLGPFNEVIDQGAFTKSLAEKDDVRLLLNHEGLPLARTKSGTLDLAQDDVGLKILARLDPADPDVAGLAPKMRRGDVDEMSFAFRVTKQQWSPDFTERHIKEVKLYDVSMVTFPANPATSAWLRMEQLATDLSRVDSARALAEVRCAGQDPGPLLEMLRRHLDRLWPAADTRGDIAEEPAAEVVTQSSQTVVPLELARAQADALRLRVS